MKCCISGCGKTATQRFQIIVPATGYPAEMPNLVTLDPGMGACEAHMDSVKAEHFLSEEGKARILGAMTSSLVPPDFDRAELRWRPIQ